MGLKLGTKNSETINGSPDDDTIFGLGGDDVLFGFKGKDQLDGGDGDDQLWGGDGDDFLSGGDDADNLYGGPGADVLDGGNDKGGVLGDRAIYFHSSAGVTVNLQTGTGSGGEAEGDTLLNIEQLTGSEFDDFLTGDDSENIFFGAGGDDDIKGGDGDDQLAGGDDNDTLNGGGNDDRLFGMDGEDNLFGGPGGDELIGGTGRDTLTGNSGDDTFVFASSEGGTYSLASDPDHILDFKGSSARSVDHDWIDMPTSENYAEPTNGYEVIGYEAGYDAAKNWVEGQKFGPYDTLEYVPHRWCRRLPVRYLCGQAPNRYRAGRRNQFRLFGHHLKRCKADVKALPIRHRNICGCNGVPDFTVGVTTDWSWTSI